MASKKVKKIKVPTQKPIKQAVRKTPGIIKDSTDFLVKNLQKSLRKVPGGTYKY